ncbi:MAG: ribonuclease P protein component [Desulfonatronovibrio sp.]
MVRLTFGRHLRITKRPLFQECYSRGRRYFTPDFIVFVRANHLAHWRLGIAASRKVGPAVKRNRVKRLIRECFRLNQHSIPVRADIVVVCKKNTDIAALNQAMVNRQIMELIPRISKNLPQA